MADVTAQPFNLGQGLVDLADTGLKGYFTYATTKETSKALAKAPAANTAIIVGGIVAIGLLIVIVIKH